MFFKHSGLASKQICIFRSKIFLAIVYIIFFTFSLLHSPIIATRDKEAAVTAELHGVDATVVTTARGQGIDYCAFGQKIIMLIL
jgi:hypothetical protein